MKLPVIGKDLGYLRNLFLTTVIGGLVGLLGYLFNVFVARYTLPEVFSVFSAATAIVYLLQIPAISIQTLITKAVGKNSKYNLNSFKWKAVLVFTIMGILFSILFFFARDWISQLASIPKDLYIYLLITLFFAFISPISKGILLGIEKIVTVNILLFIETIMKLGIGFVAIKMGGNIPLLILANAVPALLTTLFVIPLTRLNGEGEKKDVNINYKELLLTTVSFLLLSTPYTIDLILVNTNFRAQYSAVSLLGKLVYFAAIMIASVMFARLANQKDQKEEKRTLVISLLTTIIIGLGVTLGLYLFRDTVIQMTIGRQYLSIAPYIIIFGFCMTGYALVYMLTNYFISKSNFGYIGILVLTTVLQIYLFLTRNSNLELVLRNQIIVYTVLTVLTVIYLLLNFTVKKNEEGNIKEDK